MTSNCIPHTELPGTSALFADYLYRFQRVAPFYEHDPHDADSFRRAAAAIQLPDERRQSVVAALRQINGDCAGLDQLELPGTVAVVTGQQVGLFSGPAYTVYKALTAARVAQTLTASGIRAVPVFWLATEDHDLAEIDHSFVFDAQHHPVRLNAVSGGRASQPVGGIEIIDSPIDGLRSALNGLPYADEVVELVADCYQPGRTYGEAFRHLLRRLLAGYGLVFIDPMQPAIREIAAPFLASALENDATLAGAATARSEALVSAGYHAQVLFEPQTSFFFQLRDGLRLSLRRKDGEYHHGTHTVSREELLANPAALSPNALLRPVMQDYLLPTVAYIGGPAELAYLAQSQVLYQSLLGRMPVALPRSGFTLMDLRARKLLDKHELSLSDCLHGEPHLRALIAERLVPPSLSATFDEVEIGTRTGLERLQSTLRAFDPTLSDAMEKSKAKVLYQLEKNRKKAARESLRRDTAAAENASHLSSLVFPERHLQERYYSILPFLAEHGPSLVDTTFEHTHVGCPDHQLLIV